MREEKFFRKWHIHLSNVVNSFGRNSNMSDILWWKKMAATRKCVCTDWTVRNAIWWYCLFEVPTLISVRDLFSAGSNHPLYRSRVIGLIKSHAIPSTWQIKAFSNPYKRFEALLNSPSSIQRERRRSYHLHIHIYIYHKMFKPKTSETVLPEIESICFPTFTRYLASHF